MSFLSALRASPALAPFARRIGALRRRREQPPQNSRPAPSYAFIAADITNGCNLRCPFCINDFRSVGKTVMMSSAVYERLLTLLPLVGEAQFYLSCLFEPTTHRNFIDFVDLIPRHERKKVFFTTNLALPLADDTVARLSHSGLAFINISIDSFQPATYEALRRGARFERFLDNLERLVAAFSTSPDAPPLRYTTMAVRPNVDEIPSIVERCGRSYRSSLHEVRFIYEVSHLDPAWKRENFLAVAEWQALAELADRSSYTVAVATPPEDYFAADGEAYSRSGSGTQQTAPAAPPVALRVSSDGTVSLYGREQTFDLANMADPLAFFTELRATLD